MTRKKSNVKALALAVTCAILAGGGIGLEPVYAVDALYKEAGTNYITTDADGATTKWKLYVIDSGLKIGGIDLGLTKEGAITAESLTLADNYNVKDKIEANKKSTEDNKAAIGTLETKTKGITRNADNSTTVDGVNFKEGAVSGVKSINGDIEFDKDGTKVWVNGAVVADGVAANNITANGSLTVGDATNYVHMTNAGIAVSGRLYSSLDPNAADLKSVSVAEMANTRDNTQQISYTADGTKINSNVIINEGKKNQVKITEEEGIVVGLGSSVVNDDGVFAGGHNYIEAKAALNASDGSIKGANGKFGVDQDGALKAADEKFAVDKDGNVTTTGALNVAKNAAVGGTLDVIGATTLGSTLDVTGKTTLSNDLQVDGKATFGSATGSQTVIEGGNITAGGKLTSGSATIGSVGIDNTGAITANSATIGGVNTLNNTGIKVADGSMIQVGGNTKIENGSIAVSTNTKLTDQALNLNATNKWTAAGGLVADKATVNGVVLGADGDTGKATFTDANGSTTIAGKNITTGKIIAEELWIDKISLGKDGSSNISIDKDGAVETKGDITIKDTAGNVMSKLSQDKATFGKDAMNQTTISKGDITATAKNTADSQQSTLTHNNNGFKVEGKDAGGTKASSFGFDTSTGIGTFTGQDNSTTAIDGSNMTLVNGDNKTELTAGGVTFTGNNYKDATAKGTTVIDGNTITTGKLVTDELVITGQGNAHGNGSIAFGGDGTIRSDINDGNYDADGKPNGKNTSFETTLDGVNTKVTDGTTTTENHVTVAGNSNTVTKGEDQKSEFKQDLTSIGGVVTKGEIKVAQYLDGETGKLINEVKDANGSSKLEQSGTGLTYTDSANTGNETRIDSGDVSIGAALDKDGNQLVDDGKEGINRINLSDLGQIDNLDDELKNRPEYKNGEEVGTAVGAINAEAGIRREEVARLDNRIDDVNNRVDKVGAMAAAIASLKSIGYDPQAPSEFSIGLGQYKGETGVAMGFFHYPNKNFMINVSLSTAGGETMGGIGATWRFGHKSPQKLLEEQREAQAKKELAAAEKYQAAAKLAKEAQERAEYAAKLARQAQVSADNAKAAADATQAKHFG